MSLKSFTNDDIVTIKNIDSEDYQFTYMAEPGYLIKAGESERLPGDMAKHALRNITDLVMQRAGETLMMNNKIAREKYYEQILVSVEPVIRPKPLNESQRAKQDYDKMQAQTAPATSDIMLPGVEDGLAEDLIESLENRATPSPSEFEDANQPS